MYQPPQASVQFICCSNYRRSALETEIRDCPEREKNVDEPDTEKLGLAVRPDHVHLFVTGDVVVFGPVSFSR